MAPVKKLLVAVFPGRDNDALFRAVTKRAAASGAEVTALHVIDPVLLRYAGADWLSTGPSRADYESYIQEMLPRQGDELILGLIKEARASGTKLTARIARGEPDEEILRTAASMGADEIIAAHDCPCLKAIEKKSACPVLVISGNS